jgi:hypothetical protein
MDKKKQETGSGGREDQLPTKKKGPAQSNSGARTGTQKSDGKDVENPT